MKKTWIIGLLVMAVLISGCTSAPTTPQPTQTQPAPTTTIQPTTMQPTTMQPTTIQPTTATAAVEIKGFAYNPLTVTISKGTTVTWTNSDSAPHTVTSVSGAFDSGSISQRGAFSYTFDQAGTFEYSCTIHPNIPHGKVIVT